MFALRVTTMELLEESASYHINPIISEVFSLNGNLTQLKTYRRAVNRQPMFPRDRPVGTVFIARDIRNLIREQTCYHHVFLLSCYSYNEVLRNIVPSVI